MTQIDRCSDNDALDSSLDLAESGRMNLTTVTTHTVDHSDPGIAVRPPLRIGAT